MLAKCAGGKDDVMRLHSRDGGMARALLCSLLMLAMARPLAAGQAQAQRQEQITPQEPGPTPQIPSKQRQELLKSNFEKMKRNADELAALVKSLQEELGRSNENVLSLKIVSQAEKIEKLARRIKEAAKGY